MATIPSEPVTSESSVAVAPPGVQEPPTAAAARATDPHRCPGCEYDLRGLRAEHTACPECGIDISDAAMKYRAALAAKRLRRSRWAFIVSPAAAIIPVLVGTFIGHPILAISAVLALLCVWVASWWWLSREVPADTFFGRCVQPFLAIVPAVIYFTYFWGAIGGVVMIVGAAYSGGRW